ncbi:MAG: dihydroorotate dehydrogenase electron transfer subunit [Syntrophothermaceae bacterium]
MSLVEQAVIIRNEEIVPGYLELELRAPGIARQALPGQFINIRVGSTLDPLLRRPFSVYDNDKNAGDITILYKVVGRGTGMMAELDMGETLDVLGPLGRPFSLPENLQRVVLVGGGVGMAPLVYLARVSCERGAAVTALVGARTASELLGLNHLQGMGVKVMVTTDDGSQGIQGQVTDGLEPLLTESDYDFIYCCGPEPMMARVADMAHRYGLEGEVALEENMACGIGACLGCAHRVKQGQDYSYVQICHEGPVFSMSEVVFDV